MWKQPGAYLVADMHHGGAGERWTSEHLWAKAAWPHRHLESSCEEPVLFRNLYCWVLRRRGPPQGYGSTVTTAWRSCRPSWWRRPRRRRSQPIWHRDLSTVSLRSRLLRSCPRWTASPHNNAESVVLDFVNPRGAGGQCVGFGGKARRNEAGPGG